MAEKWFNWSNWWKGFIIGSIFSVYGAIGPSIWEIPVWGFILAIASIIFVPILASLIIKSLYKR